MTEEMHENAPPFAGFLSQKPSSIKFKRPLSNNSPKPPSATLRWTAFGWEPWWESRNARMSLTVVALVHGGTVGQGWHLTQPLGADAERGAFLPPMLMRQDNPHNGTAVHNVEAFGPVSTLMPYRDNRPAGAGQAARSLCCSITTFDRNAAATFVRQAAPMHGRILVLDRECAKESTGMDSPMPLLVHGGPGRAGGGEEMGGLRGIKHYMQRTAIHKIPPRRKHCSNGLQPAGERPESEPHVFRKHFEELNVGDTVTTARHTVTEADISNFANVSGDHFYAHVDGTSL